MQSLTQIKALLADAGLAPRKSLGQNFLVDHNLITRLLDAAGPPDPDCPLALEIGPGTGAMTESLLERGWNVVACELDHGLCALLRQRLGGNPDFTLIEGDCLGSKSSLAPEIVQHIKGRPFRLIANLPYGPGTSVLLAILTRHPECRRLAVTVQREVADRLSAAPGSGAYGSISVVAQCVATITRVATLPPECFWPRPEVTSAMIVLDRLPEPLTRDAAGLADFCKRAFAGRRKQLRGLLKSLGYAVALPDAIAPESRVEDLTPTQIADLHARCSESPMNRDEA